MKRYLSFYGDAYYPSGGMEDFIGDYATEHDALNAITEKFNRDISHYPSDEQKWSYKWAHIFDTETLKIVWSK